LKIFGLGQHRRLLFRSYLVIVGGLIVIAAVLDFSLDQLQNQGPPIASQWIDGNLSLVEAQLNSLPASQWPAVLDDLEHKLGFPVRVFPSDHVVRTQTPGSATQEVFDAQGRAAYIRTSPLLNSVIQIGPLAETAPENTLVLLIPPLFYLSIFVFVGLWLWPLVRDLNVLTDSARLFAADYRRPINTLEKVTSLRELAGSFDEMSARIGNLIQRQKELTGALSHEMRTPLARIKFAMAVVDDKEDVAGELESISQDVREIEELITSMLDYARLDHPDREVNLQLTQMDTWLAQVVSDARLQDQGLRIEHKASGGQVQIDPGLMKLAVSNLLVNACRYANTQVLAQFSDQSGRCLLSVEDDGQGIPEAERKTVFKAFTRLDGSRNRETGGHGLGLAIVARIASLHGGSAWAEQSSLGGARIVIAWNHDNLREDRREGAAPTVGSRSL
jgi:signal transduction histidine kinase